MLNKINFLAVMFTAYTLIISNTLLAQTPTAPIRKIAAHLDSLVKTDHFSGVVLIAQHGKPLLQKAYGFSNLADHIPNRYDTRFNLASMGKMFTATAIMQLVQDHKITLQATVGQYLPNYPNKAVRDSVTIYQLLTHTSGMGNFWEELDKVAFQHYRTLLDYLPLFANKPLQTIPGTFLSYSNSGYMVLGMVIEAVTGTNYFDYVTEHVFRAAGMKQAGFTAMDDVVSNTAAGYTRSTSEPGKYVNNYYTGVIKGLPAGGCYASANDLLQFATALSGNRLLNAANVKEMTTGKYNYERGKYGLGFVEEAVNNHRIIGHSGGNIGIGNELMVITDLGYTVVILTNGDVDNYWNVDAFIRKQLVGPTPQTENYDCTQNLIKVTLKNGFAAGEKMMKDLQQKITIRSGLIEQAAFKLLWEKKTREAVSLCRLNLAAFPDREYLYLNLADACRQAGDRQEAIINYKKYLEKEPDDQEAATQLKQLLQK